MTNSDVDLLSQKIEIGQIWLHKKTQKRVAISKISGDVARCMHVSVQLIGNDKNGKLHYWWILVDNLVRSYVCPAFMPCSFSEKSVDKLVARKQVTDAEIEQGITYVTQALRDQYKKKGKGAFVSRHECLGVVKEEYDELSEAVREQNITKFRYELADIAVAAIAGIISIDSNKLDW